MNTPRTASGTMVAPIILALAIFIPAVTSAHTGSIAHSNTLFKKTFAHSQHGDLKVRDLDWNPDMVNCASQCAVLVNAFTCKTSQCFCTDTIAEGYMNCMICSIKLSQNHDLLLDAQASQDELSENCRSDGYPVDNFVVTYGDITYTPPANPPSVFIPPMGQTYGATSTVYLNAPTANPQVPSGTRVVYSWQPEPTTITTDGATIWYGGSSFGMAAGFSTGFGSSSGSTLLPGFPDAALSSAAASNTPSPLADNAASGSSASPNSTDPALNPQNTNTSGTATSHMIPILSLAAVLSAATFHLL